MLEYYFLLYEQYLDAIGGEIFKQSLGKPVDNIPEMD